MRCLPLVLAGLLAGCVAPFPTEPAQFASLGDAPLRLPVGDWWNATRGDMGYHPLDDVYASIDALAALGPGVARVATIGESNEARPLRAIVLGEGAGKPALWIDGGHHANEVEGVEASLHLAETLLTNYATNATIRALVDEHEIWILPLVNPDGYVVQTRYNANYVNLNRNYDVAWCQPGAYNTCLPVTEEVMGSPLAEATGPPPEYAGREAFSEPESSAIRDATTALADRLKLYVSHHTDVHCITAPWTAPNPPFEMPANERAAFDAVFDWVRANTGYGAGAWTWGTGECMAYSAGGTSMDWVYATHRVPSFTFEVSGCPERAGRGNFVGECAAIAPLSEEVANALTVQLMLLVNAQALAAWETTLVDPPVVEDDA